MSNIQATSMQHGEQHNLVSGLKAASNQQKSNTEILLLLLLLSVLLFIPWTFSKATNPKYTELILLFYVAQFVARN